MAALVVRPGLDGTATLHATDPRQPFQRLEPEGIACITSPENSGRSFRISDLKSFIEPDYPGTGKKLIKGAAFEWSAGAPPPAT